MKAVEAKLSDEEQLINDQIGKVMKLPAVKQLIDMYMEKILLISVAHGVTNNIDYNKPSVSAEGVANFIKRVVAELK